MDSTDFPFEFASLTQLGQLLGTSAVAVGRNLRALRLRDACGEPTEKAKEAGMVEQVELGFGTPFWAWHVEKTLRLFGAREDEPVEERLKLVSAEASPPILVGPFAARRSDPDGDGYELEDANGVVGVWTRG